MRRFITRVLAGVALGACWLRRLAGTSCRADDPSLLQIDNGNLCSGREKTTRRQSANCSTRIHLDRRRGKTRARADVLKSLPTPALGNETGGATSAAHLRSVSAVDVQRDRVTSAHLGKASGRAGD